MINLNEDVGTLCRHLFRVHKLSLRMLLQNTEYRIK